MLGNDFMGWSAFTGFTSPEYRPCISAKLSLVFQTKPPVELKFIQVFAVDGRFFWGGGLGIPIIGSFGFQRVIVIIIVHFPHAAFGFGTTKQSNNLRLCITIFLSRNVAILKNTRFLVCKPTPQIVVWIFDFSAFENSAGRSGRIGDFVTILVGRF